MKDINEYHKCVDTVDSVILPCQSVIQLLSADTKGTYFSENNENFLEECS